MKRVLPLVVVTVLGISNLYSGDSREGIAVSDMNLSQLFEYHKNKGDIIVYDKDKAYSSDNYGWYFPTALKCTKYDKRIFHTCMEFEVLTASTRIYFDKGGDDNKGVDLYNDGKLNLSLELASIYLPWRFGRSEFYDKWSWGPAVSFGIGTLDGTSKDDKVSTAPAVFISGGGFIRYKPANNVAFYFELGRTIGYTSDEAFSEDNHDTATYVGFKINIQQ